MKNKVISINIEEVFKKAWEYFKERSKIDIEETENSLVKESIDLYEKLTELIEIKVILSRYYKIHVLEQSFMFDDVTIGCEVLESIEKSHIRGVYLYMLTLGEYQCDYEGLMEQFIVDIWETALIDASREYIRDYIRNLLIRNDEGEKYVSDSFGPGYYGIGMEEVNSFFKVLDASKIGVTLNSNGIMKPMNSIVGLYLESDKNIVLPSNSCKTCIGGSVGCSLCSRKG